MGWQDAPVVSGGGGGWRDAPVVDAGGWDQAAGAPQAGPVVDAGTWDGGAATPVTDAAAVQAEANGIQMPNPATMAGGAARAGRAVTGSLPTTDQVRAALEEAPGWNYSEWWPLAGDKATGRPSLAIPGFARSALLGMMDVGQGRAIGTPGDWTSIRATPDTTNALMALVSPTPAAGTGRAIAETAAHGAPLNQLYMRNRPAPVEGAAAGARTPAAAAEIGTPPMEPARAPVQTSEPATVLDNNSPEFLSSPKAPAADLSKVYTPAGTEIGVRYEVVDAANLRTSHTLDLRPNKDYPAEVQPRDRGRAASEAQIETISRDLKPERLGVSQSANEGAPIIGPDGVVESGNGRTIALRRAYQRGEAGAYQDWLAGQGFDTTGMKEPVLVRRRVTDMTPQERQRFAQEANADPGLAMSASERAAQDAARLDSSTLDLYRGGDLGTEGNADFVRAFVRNVSDPGQEGALASRDGLLTVDGANRVRNALAQRAYGDNRLVSALAETGDENIKAFGGALMDAAGGMAKLRQAIEAGTVDPAVGIGDAAAEAAALIQSARQRKISIGDMLAQQDAFGRASDQAAALLQAAYGPEMKGRMSRGRFAAVLEQYARQAAEQPAGGNLFGGGLGWRELLDAAAKQERPAAPLGGPRNALLDILPQQPARKPESVGAATTPGEATGMTAAEAAAARAQGDRYQMMDTARPGDVTEYVPGVKPTLAEVELTPAAARTEKQLRMEQPQQFVDRAQNEAAAYQDYYNNLAGSPTMTLRMREARAAQAERDLAAAWKDKMPADIRPVEERIAAIIDGPDGRRPLVRREVGGLLDELRDAKGKAITDPEILYGVRKSIDDMISKEAQREKPLNKRVEALLLDVKAELDNVIEAAAPGFRQYLANYAEASKPIDVSTLMQDAADKLFSGAGRSVTFHRFDRFMRDLASDRAASGVNPAKSIDEATWDQLIAMHRSLQRTQTALDLAKAPGSDTAQNIYDRAKLWGVRGVAHGIAAMTAPVVGNALIPIAEKAITTKRQQNLLMRHLQPDPTRYRPAGE